MNLKYLALLLFSIINLSGIAAPPAKPELHPAPLTFAGVKYFHRWVENDQNEYTPNGQENLEHWFDMVTINYYRQVKEGEGLADMANKVLGNYQANRAAVIKTDSVPRTAQKPAEHLIVVLFSDPDFLEVAFARFVLTGGMGSSHIYCHREWGKEAHKLMDTWLKKNGSTIEKELMNFKPIPLDQSL